MLLANIQPVLDSCPVTALFRIVSFIIHDSHAPPNYCVTPSKSLLVIVSVCLSVTEALLVTVAFVA